MRNHFIIAIFVLWLSACASQPHTYSCEGARADGHIYAWHGSPFTPIIQRDAGFDKYPRSKSQFRAFAVNKEDDLEDFSPSFVREKSIQDRISTIFEGYEKDLGDSLTPEDPNVLLLSGGGHWGAYGAGFLNALQSGAQRVDFTVVTGISTGAIQGLFVAAGKYQDLEDQYRIDDQEEVAKYIGIRGLLLHGGLYKTNALHKGISEFFCNSDCENLEQLANPEKPNLFIGFVRMSDGQLLYADVKKIVQSFMADLRPGNNQRLTYRNSKELVDCLTGITMASSSVPFQMTPVKIDGRTYTDGGVRASVLWKNEKNSIVPSIYVVRNGPTVVSKDRLSGSKPNNDSLNTPFSTNPKTIVDESPNSKNVALRAYSTLVNQAEVDAIAQLRLGNSSGNIKLTTADGYYASATPKCINPNDGKKAFDETFMHCLIQYGRKKARACSDDKPDWIILPSNADVHVAPKQTSCLTHNQP